MGLKRTRKLFFDNNLFKLTGRVVCGAPIGLNCIYNNQRNKPLRCEWNIPQNLRSTIRYYNVKITYNGTTVFEGISSYPSISLEKDLIDGANYSVTVTPVANGQCRSASTIIAFEKVGKGTFWKRLHSFNEYNEFEYHSFPYLS